MLFIAQIASGLTQEFHFASVVLENSAFLQSTKQFLIWSEFAGWLISGTIWQSDTVVVVFFSDLLKTFRMFLAFLYLLQWLTSAWKRAFKPLLNTSVKESSPKKSKHKESLHVHPPLQARCGAAPQTSAAPVTAWCLGTLSCTDSIMDGLAKSCLNWFGPTSAHCLCSQRENENPGVKGTMLLLPIRETLMKPQSHHLICLKVSNLAIQML